MIASASETLDFLKSAIPAGLVNSATVGRIKDLVERLPASMSHFYFECRLDSNNRVDFHTCVTAANGRELLREHICGPKSALSHLVALRNFVEEWSGDDGPLRDRIPLVWLEFDSDHLDRLHPVPNVLFCVQPRFPHQSWFTADTKFDVGAWRACDRGLTILADTHYDSTTRATIRRVFEVSSGIGKVLHVSVMQGRDVFLIKLNMQLPVAAVEQFLSDLNWPGMKSTLMNVVDQLCIHSTMAKIDLAIDSHIAPTLGLEFFSSADGDADSTTHISRLSGLPRTVSSKLNELGRWPGAESVVYRNQIWPLQLTRWLDTKVVVDGNGGIESKAYLGFSPRFSFDHT